MSRIILIFLMLFIANPVFANVYSHKILSSQVALQLPKIQSVKGTFAQTKYIQGVSPITSSGNFEFIEEKGVIFTTLYPKKFVVSYTSADNKQINDIVLAISKNNFTKLDKNFDVFFEKNVDFWTLALVPKQSSKIRKELKSIEIVGSHRIDKITICQSCVKTVISFQFGVKN